MSENMTLTYIAEKALWEFKNGDKNVLLTANELAFMAHAVERNGWEANIDMEIDSNEDNLDFGQISKDELIALCMEDLEWRWENMTLGNEPDYQEVVFDVANENGVWRD